MEQQDAASEGPGAPELDPAAAAQESLAPVQEMPPTKLCVALTGTSVREQLAQAYEAKRRGADVVEIRLDYLEDFLLNPAQNLSNLITNCSLPAIVTFRPVWEGCATVLGRVAAGVRSCVRCSLSSVVGCGMAVVRVQGW